MSKLKAHQFLTLLKETNWWHNLEDSKYKLKPNGGLEFAWSRNKLCLFCQTDHNHSDDMLRLRFWDRPQRLSEHGFFCGSTMHRFLSPSANCLWYCYSGPDRNDGIEEFVEEES